MKNLFAYDFTNRTIVATKATLKKASTPDTKEYKALMKMLANQPTFRVVEKEIAISNNKNGYRGLTFEVMRTHIQKNENSDNLMAEFDEILKIGKGKYPLAKKWFLEQFPDFKAEGKKAVSNAKIAKAKANAKIVRTKASASHENSVALTEKVSE